MLPAYTQSKTATENTVTIQGNLAADDSTKMSVSAEGAAHIMSLLTDLYSDPNLAVLREYSSNAYDSHKAAGQTKPVEITMPSAFSPTFMVQDFGVGMSADEIRTIYSSYGASTKRNDFEQVGAFGLGCKSALTLTQSFTIRSVKDNQQTIAIIARGEDGVGTVNIIAENHTYEPNGVTVTIPIPDPSAFTLNATKVFFAWPKDSVLVDGKKPQSLYDSDTLRLSPSGLFYYDFSRPSSYYEVPRIVMGGVAYRVETRKLGLTYEQQRDLSSRVLYAEIPIGAVDLTPSREDIRYSDRSNKFLTALWLQVLAETPAAITRDFAEAKTRREALKLAHDYESNVRYSTHNATWQGEKVPTTVNFTGAEIHYSANANRMSTSTGAMVWPLYRVAEKNVVVFETDPLIDNRLRRNIKQALIQLYPETWKSINVLLTSNSIFTDNPWVKDNEDYEFVSSQAILDAASEYRKANRKSKAAVSAPKTKLSELKYRCLVWRDGEVQSKSLTQSEMTGDVYYIDEDRFSFTSGLTDAWTSLKLAEDTVVVIMPKTRDPLALQDRLKKPVRSTNALGSKTKPEADLVEAIINQSVHGSTTRYLDSVSKIGRELGDDELTVLNKAIVRARVVNERRNKLSVFRTNILFEAEAKRAQIKLDNVYKRFPLLRCDYAGRSLLDNQPEHAKLYIEAVLKAEREAK